MAQGAADHDAVGAGRFGRVEDGVGELDDDAGAREGEVGAAAFQAMGPGDGFGTGRFDDPLHDGGGFDAVQVGDVGGAGQQAAVVAGDLEAGQRLVDRGGQALQAQVLGQDLQQVFDLAVQFDAGRRWLFPPVCA